MTREHLATRIRAIISDQLEQRGDSEVELKDATKIVADLGLDSITLLEATMAIEDEFEIELDDAELADLVTLGELITHVADRLAVPA